MAELEKKCCFVGHRTILASDELTESLTKTIERLIAEEGVKYFLFGSRSEFMYRLKYTYSENWGTYINPFFEKKYTTSLLADFIYAPDGKKWLVSASFAHDWSNYIGNNAGIMISFARIGVFK